MTVKTADDLELKALKEHNVLARASNAIAARAVHLKSLKIDLEYCEEHEKPALLKQLRELREAAKAATAANSQDPPTTAANSSQNPATPAAEQTPASKPSPVGSVDNSAVDILGTPATESPTAPATAENGLATQSPARRVVQAVSTGLRFVTGF